MRRSCLQPIEPCAQPIQLGPVVDSAPSLLLHPGQARYLDGLRRDRVSVES